MELPPFNVQDNVRGPAPDLHRSIPTPGWGRCRRSDTRTASSSQERASLARSQGNRRPRGTRACSRANAGIVFQRRIDCGRHEAADATASELDPGATSGVGLALLQFIRCAADVQFRAAVKLLNFLDCAGVPVVGGGPWH